MKKIAEEEENINLKRCDLRHHLRGVEELLLGDLSTWILLEEAVEGDHSVDVGEPVLLDEELHSVQLNEY